MDVVPLQGAIVVCYGWGGRVTTNFGRVDVVPLLGAIVVCYGWGGTTNFAGVDVVLLLGAIVVCYGWEGFFLYIDNTKIVFCYLGSMLVKFFPGWQFPQQGNRLGSEGTFSFEHTTKTS